MSTLTNPSQSFSPHPRCSLTTSSPLPSDCATSLPIVARTSAASLPVSGCFLPIVSPPLYHLSTSHTHGMRACHSLLQRHPDVWSPPSCSVTSTAFPHSSE